MTLCRFTTSIWTTSTRLRTRPSLTPTLVLDIRRSFGFTSTTGNQQCNTRRIRDCVANAVLAGPLRTQIRGLHADTMAATQTAVDYEKVLKGKYPGMAHARRVVEYMRAASGGEIAGTLYLEGQKTRMIEDNDEPMPFRQRRFFYYLTGCPLADATYTYDLATGESTLYIPPIDPDSVMWSGLPVSEEEASLLYDVTHVLTTDKLEGRLAAAAATHTGPVWTIAEQVSIDLKAIFPARDGEAAAPPGNLLKEAIEECRVAKDEYEVALTRKANAITTIGHTAVMGAVRTATNERELEGLFLSRSVGNGAKEQAYHSIVASGTAAATLHYVNNGEPLAGKLNVLLDAGAEYNCYASDVTRTFPISGTFSSESAAIYNIVLQMQKVCTSMLRAGVNWDDVHLKAHEIAIEGLLDIGILKGDKEAILKARTSVAFFPHGLGHYMGMDTHDTGGHPNYEDEDKMFRYLRVRGPVQKGGIITVEPGIYFCEFIIKPYLTDPAHSGFIDADVLARYWAVGGVRIEDNILITQDGWENLTTTPKEIHEMERIIRGE